MGKRPINSVINPYLTKSTVRTSLSISSSFSNLAKDFAKPISFASGRKGEKDLFYWTVNNEMKVKTYTDYGILESAIVFVNNK